MADEHSATDPGAALRAQFRGPLPPAVMALPPADALDLADALRAARRRQARHLGEATEESLGQLPRLLRPLVRRAIGL
ncbi:hypothetical protein [Actinokineospora globicatena]|uniref:Uncharacterized protein n=1 Tax=Actinokineospora globicatena TaxID=103729 RepID=A0A9W6QPH4_9PSEU|nr:hypothetical protein [Actinokineospora globicatena]GLW94163.1 hypothetical protein Aglo03_49790 [Actinokineospora globicatena]